MPDVDAAIYQFRRTDEELAAKRLAQTHGLPYVNLVGYSILPHTLSLVELDAVKDHSVVPYLRFGAGLKVAAPDPSADLVEYLQGLANRLGLDITLAVCSPASFQFVYNRYLLEAKKESQAQTIAVSQKLQAESLLSVKSKEALERRLTHASATEVLDLLFAAATGMEASDIHIEPQETAVRVRFRLDGVLQDVTTLTKEVHHAILSRVKFLAQMKLDVRATGQDGRFSVELGSTKLDVRVSTLPSIYGEIIETRLLRPQNALIKLDSLNLTPEILTMIKSAIALPHGMVLVSGPTGSGKTTTLYAIVDALNKPEVEIVTLEDPVEYHLAGIDQIPISADAGLGFAQALRSALRQDPDIIMVGEIRDRDTAEISLQSAMTGHLLLTTLHTNNAPAALSRLMDMGIEPYKIAGAINLILAQRLVRLACFACHGAGCPKCHQTGFHGRAPIVEALGPSRALDEAITRHASSRELYELALKQGMKTMFDDGMAKVAQGLTTEAEVKRVTAEAEHR